MDPIKYELLDYLVKFTDNSTRVEEIIINPGFTGVLLENDAMGLAMNVRSSGSTDRKINTFLQEMIDMQALNAASKILDCLDRFDSSTGKSRLLHSVLVALFNAQSKPYLNRESLSHMGCRAEVDTAQASAEPAEEQGPAEIVAFVGFGGMVRGISLKARKTYVSELNPELFSATRINSRGIGRGPDRFTLVNADQAKDCFKEAGTVFVTGCALVTDTMDEILAQCRGKNIIVYGATASFLPQPLLNRGVKLIRATDIRDASLMVDLLVNCAGTVERFFSQACKNLVIRALPPLS